MRTDRGFSLVELLAVLAFFVIVSAVAMPVYVDIVDSMRLGQATRDVERELQTARLKAVSTNRKIRVRFNCPAAGQYRMVQVLGTTADVGTTRCSEAAYPYDSSNQNPVTKRQDGPLRYLQNNVTLPTGAFEFWPNGTAYQVDTAGVAQVIPPDEVTGGNDQGVPVTLTKDGKTKEIWVNGRGKIQIVQ
jgi:prepilin-type N-terminal cleavage/methylation domain-containing protein